MLLFTFITIGESDARTTPALMLVVALVVWVRSCPPVILSVAVLTPADLAKTRGRLAKGTGAVPGGEPTGNARTEGPI